MSVVAAAKGARLRRNLSYDFGAGNILTNPNFDQDNYPVWRSWNGVPYGANVQNQVGDFFKGIAGWLHYSSLFNSGYATYVGNQFLFPEEPYDLDDFDGYPNKMSRIIKLYGAGQYYNNLGSVNNSNTDRGSSITGPFTGAASVRIVSNSALTSIGSTTPDNSSSNWTRHEWSQIVDIPDDYGSTTYGIRFGAKVRVDPNDKLRNKNFGGIYCAEDRNSASGSYERYVNYFGIQDTNANWYLPTGQLSSAQAPYNWNGLYSQYPTSGNVNHLTPTSVTATQHAMLDQDDYGEFKIVYYDFTPQSGTNRTLIFTLFFAENHSYLGGSESPIPNTGSVQFFDPFCGVINL